MKHLLPIIVIVFSIFSCKKKNNVDNVYEYREYISYKTNGLVSIKDPWKIGLTQGLLSYHPLDTLPQDIITISPNAKGSAVVTTTNEIVFYPKESLRPDTKYKITVHLSKLYDSVEKEFSRYTFSVQTLKPNFSVEIEDLQSYDTDWQYMNGVVKLSDIVPFEEAKHLIKAKRKKESLQIQWENPEAESSYYRFKIDSISREMDDSEITISWNGKPIDAKTKGKLIRKIPGKNNFSIISVDVKQSPNQYLAINFSDPLKNDQNFNGLVELTAANEEESAIDSTDSDAQSISYTVDGNLLNVYTSQKLVGYQLLEVFAGIESQTGFKLNNDYQETLTFEQIKPEVRLLNGAGILPNAEQLKVNIEAVNLRAVDVRIIKIYKQNVLQFLQQNNIGSNSERSIKRVGRKVAFKTIKLIENDAENTGNWKAYSIDLTNLFKTEPGAIYRVELSTKKEYAIYDCSNSDESNNEDNDYYYEDDYEIDTNEEDSYSEEIEEEYWDNMRYSYRKQVYNWRQEDNPCHDAYYNDVVACNLISSNLGVIAKQGNNKSYLFAVTNILNTNPEAGATVEVFNYQQQSLGQQQTNSHGIAKFNFPSNAYFAVVSKGEHTTYIKLEEDNALSVSKFDVAGQTLNRGLKGYIYGERGVWRPGDNIYLTFILNDLDNPLPENHPVELTVTDAQGKLIHKTIKSESKNKVYDFLVPTSTDDVTGKWQAVITVGGAKFYKTLKVETVKPNRLKMKLDFYDEILSDDINGSLQVNYLHGAPAKNVKAEIDAVVYKNTDAFSRHTNYSFLDPTIDFSSEEIKLFDGDVNESGYASIQENLSINEQAPGMLSVSMLIRAFEPGGGFSITSTTKQYAPFDNFVGIRKPEGNQWGALYTGENQTFDILSVDKNGNPKSANHLQIKVYKVEWRWWWSSSYDDLSSYQSSEYHDTFFEKEISTNSNGKASFRLNIPEDESGRYLILVTDLDSGHTAGETAYFYRNWWDADFGDNKDAAKMLVFFADKEKYNVGENAKVTFPSGEAGRALISIENGTEVLSTMWVETKKGNTTATIPVTKEMAPNVFINISLLQPHDVTENDLPVRLYGIIPMMVEDKNTILQPQLSMPDELRPEQNSSITVSEKNGKAMTYTIAIVDDGLLDLTSFKTPNAWDSFYAREALGVRTYDIFDDVIGSYTGKIDQVFAIGGGADGETGKLKKANRFKPVVTYLGPFELKPGQKQKHNISIPKYIGSVRTMVVAADNKNEAYGSVEKTIPVRQPIMTFATLPRKLSTGEKVTLPVTVFTMNNKIKNVNVSVNTSSGITINGLRSQSLSFSNPDEKMAYFDLTVGQSQGVKTIEVVASGDGETSSYEVEIDVVNPNPFSIKANSIELQANQSNSINVDTFGEPGTNTAQIEFSTLPAMDISGRLSYLIQYPHGCVEQTTSSVFPQLFLVDVVDLTSAQKQDIERNIKKGILRLSKFQKSNGGLSYWIGESDTDSWGTSYAGHFMLEAEKQGYALPYSFKLKWIQYQKEAARSWRANRYSSDLNQAYRLYTLALAGSADLSAMNRLRQQDDLSNDAKWRLAAAYSIAGQKEAANAIIKTASVTFANAKESYYSYGSEIRNKAMALETMILLDNSQKQSLIKDIASDLSSSQWMSTQTTAYALLAVGKFVKINGGKSFKLSYSINGSQDTSFSSHSSIGIRDLAINEGQNKVTIKNLGNSTVYVRTLTKGKLPLGKELQEQRGLDISVKYVTKEGEPVDVSSLTQGSDFLASIVVQNTTNRSVDNVALTQIFPSGWEIVNTRFTDVDYSITGSQARYSDYRDDRVHFYFTLDAKQSKQFLINVNAAYLGTYYLPGTQAEAMYDNDYLVRNKGQWIDVIK